MAATAMPMWAHRAPAFKRGRSDHGCSFDAAAAAAAAVASTGATPPHQRPGPASLSSFARRAKRARLMHHMPTTVSPTMHGSRASARHAAFGMPTIEVPAYVLPDSDNRRGASVSPETAMPRGAWDERRSTPHKRGRCQGSSGEWMNPQDYGVEFMPQSAGRRVRRRLASATAAPVLSTHARLASTSRALVVAPLASRCASQAWPAPACAPRTQLPPSMLAMVKYDSALDSQQRQLHRLPPAPSVNTSQHQHQPPVGGGLLVEEVDAFGNPVGNDSDTSTGGCGASMRAPRTPSPVAAPLPVVPDTSVGEQVPDFFRRPGSPLIEIVSTTPTSPPSARHMVAAADDDNNDVDIHAASCSSQGAATAWLHSLSSPTVRGATSTHIGAVSSSCWDDDDDVDML